MICIDVRAAGTFEDPLPATCGFIFAPREESQSLAKILNLVSTLKAND